MLTLRAPPKDGVQAEGEDVLLLGKKRFAAGLVWFTADADLAETTALVKQRARHLSADFYCSRSTVVSQQGYGFLAKGHRMAMPSAAAIAADSLIGEWHGVFSADNGWWYVAVHSDAVAPDGDRFFRSEEEVYGHFIQAAEAYKWPRSYAPVAWNLPNTNGEIQLARLIGDPGSAISSLKPITLDAFFGGPQRKKIALASASVFVLLVLAMISVLAAVSSGQKRARDVAAPPFTLSAPIGDIIKPPPPPPLRKGGSGDINLQIPPPAEVFAACMGAFDRLMLPLPGWDMLLLKCDGTNASVEWKKVSGSLLILQSALARFPPQTLVNYGAGDKFVASLNVAQVKPRPSRIMNRDTAVFVVNKRFADLGGIQMKPVIPKPPPRQAGGRQAARPGPGGAAAAPKNPTAELPPPLEPPYLDFVLTSTTPPTSLSWAFDVAGLRLVSVTWDMRTRLWTYKSKVLFNNEAAANNVRTPP